MVLLRVEFGALTHSECLLLLLLFVNWLLFQLLLFLGPRLLLLLLALYGRAGVVAQFVRLGAVAELLNEMELCLILKSEFVDDDDSVEITSL